MSGAEGPAGAVVSIVTLNAEDATEVFPAASVALAVMLAWVPSFKELTVIPGEAKAAAVPLPICVAPSKMVTVLPASAVPVNVGVVTLVILSLFKEPVSLAAVMANELGATGAVTSHVTVAVLEAVLPF